MEFLLKPNFYTIQYTFQQEKPKYNFNLMQFSTFFEECKEKKIKLLENTFYMCVNHQLNLTPVDKCCVLFSKFKHSFNLIDEKDNKYTFIPPAFFTNKNLNFFMRLVSEIKMNSTNIDTFYDNFKKSSFKYGTINNLLSGNKSAMRTKILGFKTEAIRGTITIDTNLSPQYISIPEQVYKTLNLATNYAVCLRHPCINTQGIYACELLYHTDSLSIKINPFICDGNKADQDGDQIQVEVIIYDKPQPSHTISAAIKELQKNSWKYGHRRTPEYQPKWSLGQHYRYITHNYDKFLTTKSPLWASLQGINPYEKGIQLINLGCSIMHQEVTEFIKYLIHCNQQWITFISLKDIIYSEGLLKNVATSKSRGDYMQLNVFTNKLNMTQQQNIFSNKNYITSAKTSFNRKIAKHNNLRKEGKIFFDLLVHLNTIHAYRDQLRDCNKIIINNLSSNSFIAPFILNSHAVEYTNKCLIKLVQDN